MSKNTPLNEKSINVFNKDTDINDEGIKENKSS